VARRAVRQQAACGYDFIKVWNVLSRQIFDSVAKQARTEGIDLVGHVPQGIPVRHAVESGIRTMEHLKGFINDATLKQARLSMLRQPRPMYGTLRPCMQAEITLAELRPRGIWPLPR
jgi:hypothetical protein